MRGIILSGIVLLFSFAAQAQVVLPFLDPGIRAESPAATGWRLTSTAQYLAGTASGDINYDTAGTSEKIGEVKHGAAAEGDDDTDKGLGIRIPSVVLKFDAFGVEINTELGDGTLTDFDTDRAYPMPTVPDNRAVIDTNQGEKDSRLYLSYFFGENLSLGAGYRQVVIRSKTITELTGPTAGTLLSFTTMTESIETGMSLVASLKLGDIFYLGGGMESVVLTGNYEVSKGTDSIASGLPNVPKTDSVDNSWTNTIIGVGMLVGEAGESQFRLEYSMIQSPESKKDAETDKLASNHQKTQTSYASLEAKFGNILLAYRNEQTLRSKLTDSQDEETAVKASMGGGWVSNEGLSLTVYSVDYLIKQETSSTKTEIHPKGFSLYLSYSF